MSETSHQVTETQVLSPPTNTLSQDRAEMIRQGEIELLLSRSLEYLEDQNSYEADGITEALANTYITAGNFDGARTLAQRANLSSASQADILLNVAQASGLETDIEVVRQLAYNDVDPYLMLEVAEMSQDPHHLEEAAMFARASAKDIFTWNYTEANMIVQAMLKADMKAEAKELATDTSSFSAWLEIAKVDSSEYPRLRDMLEAQPNDLLKGLGYVELAAISADPGDLAVAREIPKTTLSLVGAEIYTRLASVTHYPEDIAAARACIKEYLRINKGVEGRTPGRRVIPLYLEIAKITHEPADFARAEQAVLTLKTSSQEDSLTFSLGEGVNVLQAELGAGQIARAKAFREQIVRMANMAPVDSLYDQFQQQQYDFMLGIQIARYDEAERENLANWISREIGQARSYLEFTEGSLVLDNTLLKFMSENGQVADMKRMLELLEANREYWNQAPYSEVLLSLAQYYQQQGELVLAREMVDRIPAMPKTDDFSNQSEPYLAMGYFRLAQALQNQPGGAPTHSLGEVLGYDTDLTQRGLNQHRLVPAGEELEALGAYGVTHGQDLHTETNLARYARLLLGASEVRDSLSPEQLATLKTQLRSEFKANFTGNENYDYRAIQFWSQALLSIEDPASIGVLLDTMRESLGSKKANRICERLLHAGNHKASEVALSIVYNEDEHWRLRYYFVSKLAQNGFVDAKLPQTLLDLNEQGLHIGRTLELMSSVANQLGVQVDSELLTWLTELLVLGPNSNYAVAGSAASLARDYSDELFASRLQDVYRFVESKRTELSEIPRGELTARLGQDPALARIYYMLNAGRSQYSLIKSYDSIKFANILKLANTMRVDEGTFRTTRIIAPEAIERVIDGRPPLPGLTWQEEIGSVPAELKATAKAQSSSVLGVQFAQVLSDPERANFGVATRSELSAKTARTITSLLGENIARLLQGEDRDISLAELQKAESGVLSRLRQNAKGAATPELKASWKSLVETTKNLDISLLPLTVVAIAQNTPDLALNPTGIMAEWSGHLLGMGNSLRAAAQPSGERTRQLTMRYLDRHDDFIESFRFADAAQCCFTSANYALDGYDAGSANWIARIARDPYFFVMQLEDTPPDAERRLCSGFVFGSYALLDGEPCLALNGVYLEGKTDSAANQVIRSISERLARPLGIRKVVVASRYGGQFSPVGMTSGFGHRLLRPRAILAGNEYGYDEDYYDDETEEYGRPTREDRLESRIYDDLGSEVNTEVVIQEGDPLYIYDVGSRA